MQHHTGVYGAPGPGNGGWCDGNSINPWQQAQSSAASYQGAVTAPYQQAPWKPPQQDTQPWHPWEGPSQTQPASHPWIGQYGHQPWNSQVDQQQHLQNGYNSSNHSMTTAGIHPHSEGQQYPLQTPTQSSQQHASSAQLNSAQLSLNYFSAPPPLPDSCQPTPPTSYPPPQPDSSSPHQWRSTSDQGQWSHSTPPPLPNDAQPPLPADLPPLPPEPMENSWAHPPPQPLYPPGSGVLGPPVPPEPAPMQTQMPAQVLSSAAVGPPSAGVPPQTYEQAGPRPLLEQPGGMQPHEQSEAVGAYAQPGPRPPPEQPVAGSPYEQPGPRLTLTQPGAMTQHHQPPSRPPFEPPGSQPGHGQPGARLAQPPQGLPAAHFQYQPFRPGPSAWGAPAAAAASGMFYQPPPLRPRPPLQRPEALPEVSPANVVDVSTLLYPPERLKRPKKILIILRGLPGSGKSHIAKRIREAELQFNTTPPRILAIDDYFMLEVEREEAVVEDNGRKGRKRKVSELEYTYEQNMEAVYQRSLLKSFMKTADEGRHSFVIIDSFNTLVDDFKDFWAYGQAKGFEVYVLQPIEQNPEVCYRRNVHERSLKDIVALAEAWQAAPPLYTTLDATSLFVAKAGPSTIVEVEMETDDVVGSAAAAAAGGADDTAGGGGAGPSSSASGTSRWASSTHPDDDTSDHVDHASGAGAKGRQRSGSGGSKRQRMAAASDKDLLAGVNDMFGGVGGGRTASGSGAVRGAGAVAVVGGSMSALVAAMQKRVRWADEEQAGDGFRMGGARQLEEVFYLEGLGSMAEVDASLAPPRPAIGGTSRLARSFRDQVKKEHTLEQRALREVMFARRGALKPHSTAAASDGGGGPAAPSS